MKKEEMAKEMANDAMIRLAAYTVGLFAIMLRGPLSPDSKSDAEAREFESLVMRRLKEEQSNVV